MKHGRNTRDAAPASDAQGMPLPARPAVSCHVDSTCFSPTRADTNRRGSNSGRFARNRADSGLNRPKRLIQAEIFKKKKKGAERTVWLISKPYFNPVSHKRQNISSFPHISSLTSLVSVLSASLFRLPCCCETLSHSALTQFVASIHSFISSLSRILNSGIIIKLSILV